MSPDFFYDVSRSAQAKRIQNSGQTPQYVLSQNVTLDINENDNKNKIIENKVELQRKKIIHKYFYLKRKLKSISTLLMKEKLKRKPLNLSMSFNERNNRSSFIIYNDKINSGYVITLKKKPITYLANNTIFYKRKQNICKNEKSNLNMINNEKLRENSNKQPAEKKLT